jgi:hypothetical protein
MFGPTKLSDHPDFTGFTAVCNAIAYLCRRVWNRIFGLGFGLILFLRGVQTDQPRIAAIAVTPERKGPPALLFFDLDFSTHIGLYCDRVAKADRRVRRVCSACAGSGQTLKCACGLVSYCNRECQQKHWPAHVDTCLWRFGDRASKTDGKFVSKLDVPIPDSVWDDDLVVRSFKTGEPNLRL